MRKLILVTLLMSVYVYVRGQASSDSLVIIDTQMRILFDSIKINTRLDSAYKSTSPEKLCVSPFYKINLNLATRVRNLLKKSMILVERKRENDSITSSRILNLRKLNPKNKPPILN